jgi:hypothetical protein
MLEADVQLLVSEVSLLRGEWDQAVPEIEGWIERTGRERRAALPDGDYAVRDGDRLIAGVEGKTPEDFTKSLIDGSLNYALAELAALPAAAVVVEQRDRALLDHQHAQPGRLLELVARLQVRYPTVPIVFADSRRLAEAFAYRYLAAVSSTTPARARRPQAGRPKLPAGLASAAPPALLTPYRWRTSFDRRSTSPWSGGRLV